MALIDFVHKTLFLIRIACIKTNTFLGCYQKYSSLRCLLHDKGLVICFYLGWSGSILQFRQNTIKVGSKSWLITLSLTSYAGFALKRELNFCYGYLSLLYFRVLLTKTCYLQRRAPACNFTINSPSRTQASPTLGQNFLLLTFFDYSILLKSCPSFVCPFIHSF